MALTDDRALKLIIDALDESKRAINSLRAQLYEQQEAKRSAEYRAERLVKALDMVCSTLRTEGICNGADCGQAHHVRVLAEAGEAADGLKAYIVECEGSDLASCVFAVDEESAREEFINKRDEIEQDDMGDITVTRMVEWDHYGDEKAVPNLAWSRAGYATTCDKCGGSYDECREPCDLYEVEGQALCETCAEAYVEARCQPCSCGTKPWASAYGPVAVRCNQCGAEVTRDTVAAVVEAWNRGERDG